MAKKQSKPENDLPSADEIFDPEAESPLPVEETPEFLAEMTPLEPEAETWAEPAGEETLPVQPPKARPSKKEAKGWQAQVQSAIDILADSDATEADLIRAAGVVVEALDQGVPSFAKEWVAKAGRILAFGEENAASRARSALQVALASG